MTKFQERMDEVKVESYEACVWYLKDVDKCKMCDAHNINFDCHCKEEMEDFCIWITKFFKLPQEDSGYVREEDSVVAKKYMAPSEDHELDIENQLYKVLIDALN